MSQISPPITYRVESKEDVIILYALREYYAAIASWSEVINYYEKNRKFPRGKSREFKSHTVHLLTQLGAFNKDYFEKASELAGLTGKDALDKSWKYFRDAQKYMRREGILNFKRKARMRKGDKGRSMALGMG